MNCRFDEGGTLTDMSCSTFYCVETQLPSILRTIVQTQIREEVNRHDLDHRQLQANAGEAGQHGRK